MRSKLEAEAARIRNRIALYQIGGGVAITAIPIGVWWYWAWIERQRITDQVRTQIRLPGGVDDTYDYLITEKCQAGDILLFDRRCERCASGPWSALHCLVAKQFLATNKNNTGRFDHVGLIVPGYIHSRHDAVDPSNLLLMEATSQGIVARPLKERLERSASRSVILLQLGCPGERRNVNINDTYTDNMNNNKKNDTNNNITTTSESQQLMVQRTRKHVEQQLCQFRDRWIALGQEKGYQWIHSTVGIGGAMLYGMHLHQYINLSGPISPAAYLVLMGLQQAAAAQNIREQDHLIIKPEDFLLDYRLQDDHSVRLRPGWKFLSPITMIETSRS